MESAPQSNPDDSGVELRSSLMGKKCVACEGDAEPLTSDQARRLCGAVPEWELDTEAGTISRQLNGRTFGKVIEKISQIAAIAEQEQHHPDLHVTGYRHLKIVLTTHAIGGLSENDYIVAAKIDEILP